jgi:hypothetical protein
MARWRATGIALLLAAAATLSLAAAAEPRVIVVGDYSISISWNSAWQLGEQVPGNRAQFQAANLHDLLVEITAEKKPSPNANPDGFMRFMIDGAAKRYNETSVEKEVAPSKFSTGGNQGYRVCATDRAPKPDEYEFVCHGITVVNGIAVNFRVLYNDAGRAQANEAFAALEAVKVVSSN